MDENQKKDELRIQLDDALKSGAGPKVARFALACLSSVPFAGGAIGGIGASWSEQEQKRFNNIFGSWLKLQEDEMKEIGQTIFEVLTRLDQTDDKIRERLESPEYLKIVKKCFRDWSAAESEEKRKLVRNLLSNSASSQICSDDVVRMFVTWIDIYSEAHFAVIREVYKNPGCTRQQIWQEIHGDPAREDSAEADLFKLLIHDLSTGHVITQHKERGYNGSIILQTPQRSKSKSNGTRYATSAFDDDKKYELTELGKQFVHYTMNEIVIKLEAGHNEDKT
ncbi:MAG: hypothetical protein NTZ13_01780 [Candidatus Parcubacteria bacterium]|nr:hypothetical protein [Candidatus Parcubacteria bacterium]